MIPFNIYEIVSILDATCIGADIRISTISINSNFIRDQCMFIALIGKKYDGHDFAKQAVFSGVCALLVSRYLSLNVTQLVVTDTHVALMKIAHWIRCKVSTKVIAITGSTGKTSVKEMTASVLSRTGKVVATEGNCNNLIGVSITLLNLTYHTNFAVVELGTSKPGELYQSSKIVSADVALINNIALSHLSGFGSLSVIKKEKGEIFSGLSDNGQAVVNLDSHALSIWNPLLKYKKVWNFSIYKPNIGTNFFASGIVLYTHGVRFILHSPFGIVPIFLSMLGKHNVSNAVAASVLAFSVGANLFDIVYGLQNMQAVPGRLFPILFNKGKLLLIDDTYNSNIKSMIAAIDVLSTMPGYRILIVSDMLELGEHRSLEYHLYIGRVIMNKKIDYVLTVGHSSHIISKVSGIGKHFQDKIKLILYLNKILFQNKFISLLVKGSRKFHMEQIVDSIKDMMKCYFG